MRRPRQPQTDLAKFSLGVAIPSTAEGWQRRLDGQERDLYLTTREPPLALLERLQRAMQLAEKGKCRVIRELTLSNVRSLFVDQEVVTIVAHGREDGCLELSDKMVTPDAFVEQVPVQFAGCVHLCGCHSEILADKLRVHNGCLVIGHKGKVDLKQGLMIYLHTLLGVLETRRPFCEVMPDLLLKWRERE